MGAVQNLTEKNYCEPAPYKGGSRIYPIDRYEIPEQVKRLAREYHFLKVPLLGQHYPGGPGDWCGRTSSSMAFNYYELIKGGDPKSRYITHWNGGDAANFVDLRLPNGDRAFHTHPTDKTRGNVSGYSVQDTLTKLFGFQDHILFPFTTPNRMKVAAEIRSSKRRLDEAFAPLLEALRANNPAVFYSGFSQRKDNPIHLILIVGFAYLPSDSGEDALWLAVANPAGQTACKYFNTMDDVLAPKKKGGGDDFDYLHLDKLGKHDIIRLVPGSWGDGRASYDLIKASKLFEENPFNDVTGDLYMDYWERRGGSYFTKATPTDAPPEVVESSRTLVRLPFDDAAEPFVPARYYFQNETARGGYFPLGSYQNVHSGVHLAAPRGGAVQPVRCVAPGQIVAIRMPRGMPGSSSGGVEEALTQNAATRVITGNHNGFVLVRHDVEELPSDPSAPASRRPGKRYCFYSLYLHLMPPTFRPGDPYAEVSWVNTIGRSNGAVVGLDPAQGSFAQRAFLVQGATRKDGPTAGEQFPIYDGRKLEQQPDYLMVQTHDDLVATAVVRPPAKDLEQAFKALRDEPGKVVTFAGPILPVDAGETLGFIEASSAVGPGFLHWEVLSPSAKDDGLPALLAYAAKRLDLGENFFKKFEEATDDNYFDDADGNSDLDRILGMLPDGDGAAAGGREHVLEGAYGPNRIAEVMRNPGTLAFATDFPDGLVELPDRLSYPVSIHLSGYQDRDLPADATYEIEVSAVPGPFTKVLPYNGKTADLKLVVPAATTHVILRPRGFHVLDGAGATELKVDVTHLKRLAAARLRAVVVKHLNEWSKAGLEKTLKARNADSYTLGFYTGSAEKKREMADLVEATAWWAHNEVPVAGPNDAPLFGGKGLPTSTKLDNVNPITLAWVLLLLLKHHKVKMVVPEAKSFEEAKKTRQIAWVPALAKQPVRRAGADMTAAAVSGGEAGPDVAVTLLLKPEGGSAAPLPLASKVPYQQGLVIASQPLSLWGKWKLAAEGESPDAIGPLSIELQKPVIRSMVAGAAIAVIAPPQPAKDKKSSPRWTVPFSKACPLFLHGWVAFKAWKGKRDDEPPTDPGAYKLCKAGLPVDARPEDAEIKIEQGFIVKGPADRGRPMGPNSHFTYKEYCDASGGKAPARLSVQLVEGVNRVRNDPKYNHPLTLQALSADGLSISLSGVLPNMIKEAADRAKDAGFFSTVVQEKADQGPVRVTAPAPSADDADAGDLVLSFDPAAVLGQLLREQNVGPEEKLVVYPGLMFPNGGVLLDPLIGSVEEGSHGYAVAVEWNKLKSKTGGEVLEAWTADPVYTIAQPGIGPVKVSSHGSNLVLQAELRGGDDAFWKAAKPTFMIDGKPAGRATSAHDLLTCNVAMHGKAASDPEKGLFNKDLSIIAQTQAEATFHGATVQVLKTAATKCSTKPEIQRLDLVPVGTASVTLQVVARAIFGLGLTVTVTSGGKQVAIKKVAFAAKDEPADLVVTYEGSLPLDALRKKLGKDEDSRTFTITVALEKPPAGVNPKQAKDHEVTRERPKPAKGPIQGGTPKH